MELEYSLTEEDYVQFNIEHGKKSPFLRKRILLQRIFGPIIFIIAPFLIQGFSDIPFWYWFTLFGITSILWFVYYPKYTNWEIKRGIMKMLEEGDNENLLNHRKLTLRVDGIQQISEHNVVNTPWEQIDSIWETEDYLFLYISSLSAYIIPKRAFNSKEDQEDFFNEIKTHKDSQRD